MKFSVPPENQGQIVEVSYAPTPAGLVKKIHDRSDQSTSYQIARWTAKLEAWAESEGPWNSRPPKTRWRQATLEEIDEMDGE
jgi:hypothetical protein